MEVTNFAPACDPTKADLDKKVEKGQKGAFKAP